MQLNKNHYLSDLRTRNILTDKEEIVAGRETQWLLDTFSQLNPNQISNRTMKKDMLRTFSMFNF